jgi:hypothetical protein
MEQCSDDKELRSAAAAIPAVSRDADDSVATPMMKTALRMKAGRLIAACSPAERSLQSPELPESDAFESGSEASSRGGGGSTAR